MTGITKSGRYLGRKKDKPDERDHKFGIVHAPLMNVATPPKFSLRGKSPYVLDQLDMQSCGPNCASVFSAFMFPELKATGASRLQIYWGVRAIENTIGEDAGVETRDLFRVLQLTGAAPETMWSYQKTHLFTEPDQAVYDEAEKRTISSFQRLSTEEEMYACLASGFPFILGIEVFDSIDSDQLAKTGVMPMPDVARENVAGGHDITVIGYDREFKQSEIFKKSGVDPALVSDHALEIQNSWGSGWGDQGHFWLPIKYATDPSLGNDSWTGRI